jgi:Fe-S cluster assembly protein SufB
MASTDKDLAQAQYVGSRVERSNREVAQMAETEYKWGWSTAIESDTIPKGLNEDVIRLISHKKNEPEWMCEWRLKAYRHWQTMTEPNWANVRYKEPDFQAISYYSAPKKKPTLQSMDEVDPELLATFEKLGIPLDEQKRLAGVAVDAVFDSVSVATTHKEILEKKCIIFCPISEALQRYPELVKQNIGSVVPSGDNFYAA